MASSPQHDQSAVQGPPNERPVIRVALAICASHTDTFCCSTARPSGCLARLSSDSPHCEGGHFATTVLRLTTTCYTAATPVSLVINQLERRPAGWIPYLTKGAFYTNPSTVYQVTVLALSYLLFPGITVSALSFFPVNLSMSCLVLVFLGGAPHCTSFQ